MAYIPNSHNLLLGDSYDGTIWTWNPEKSQPTSLLNAYPIEDPLIAGSVDAIAIDSSGSQIATGTLTGGGAPPHVLKKSVHIFDAASGRLIGAPLDGKGLVHPLALAYTPDGRYLIVGHVDDQQKVIYILDEETHEPVDVVHGASGVYDVAVSADGRYFAAATGHQAIVWALPAIH